MRQLRMTLIAGVSLLGGAGVWAGDFDGSKPLICAVIKTVSCPRNEDVETGTAEDIDLPQFFFIDFEKKMVTGKAPDGEVRETKIENLKREGGKLFLQGVQRGRAWSAVINEETGKTTIIGTDDEGGFVVFAACTLK